MVLVIRTRRENRKKKTIGLRRKNEGENLTPMSSHENILQRWWLPPTDELMKTHCTTLPVASHNICVEKVCACYFRRNCSLDRYI